MCVVRDILYAEHFDTEMGLDGKMYIALYVDGVMSWVCLDDDNQVKKKKKHHRKNSQSKYPLIPIDCVVEHDVYTGEDGKSYIAKCVRGKMCWKLHTPPKDNSINVTVNVFITINKS
jgi:hypothetical protein